MGIQDVMLVLAKEKVSTSIHYDTLLGKVYVNLETDAKSHLYLYEDWVIRGRYDYERNIEPFEDTNSLISVLCHEFKKATHGRSYCNSNWFDLCLSRGIKIG